MRARGISEVNLKLCEDLVCRVGIGIEAENHDVRGSYIWLLREEFSLKRDNMSSS